MPQKTDDLQYLKSNLRDSIVRWFCGLDDSPSKRPRPEYIIEKIDADPASIQLRFLMVTDEKKKVVSEWPKEQIISYLIAASIDECKYGIYGIIGAQGHFARRTACDAFDQICATLQYLEHDRCSELEKPLVAIGDMRLAQSWAYAFLRLPFTTDPEAIAYRHGKNGSAEQNLKRQAGSFLLGIMSRMSDYCDETESSLMFEILQCFIARTLTETAPSSEFVYWYGEGGDGKGTLASFIVSKLKNQATTLNYSRFEKSFSVGVFGPKRLVVIDEAPKGNFFTEDVKTYTGNTFVTIERKGRDIETIRNRMILLFLSNQTPSFDGSRSQERRFRYVHSTKNTEERSAEDLTAELETVWESFVHWCVLVYERHGQRMPKNSDNDLEELQSDYFGSVDAWIADNLEYSAGAFIPTETFRRMVPKMMSRGQIEKRISRLRPDICDADKLPLKGRDRMPHESHARFGLVNVRPHSSLFEMNRPDSHWRRAN